MVGKCSTSELQPAYMGVNSTGNQYEEEMWPNSIHLVFSGFHFTFYSVFLIPIKLPFIMFFFHKIPFFFKVHMVCQKARQPGLGHVMLNICTTLAGSWRLNSKRPEF